MGSYDSEPVLRCNPISECQACPYYDLKRTGGSVAYIPTCGNAKRALPFTVHPIASHAGAFPPAVAETVPGVPDWCPLPILEVTHEKEDREGCNTEEHY